MRIDSKTLLCLGATTCAIKYNIGAVDVRSFSTLVFCVKLCDHGVVGMYALLWNDFVMRFR